MTEVKLLDGSHIASENSSVIEALIKYQGAVVYEPSAPKKKSTSKAASSLDVD